jgi:hypothetical protein
VLKRIFGLNRDEVMEEWKKLLNKDLHNLYSLPSIIKLIIPKRMKWAGHVP